MDDLRWKIKTDPRGMSLLDLLIVLGVKPDIAYKLSAMRTDEILALEYPDLRAMGISDVAAQRLVAALRLVWSLQHYRASTVSESQPSVVTHPRHIAEIAYDLIGPTKAEHMVLIIFNVRHHVLSAEILFKGDISGISVCKAQIFRRVLKHNGSAFALVHNHPSGNVAASRQDEETTLDILKASRAVGVEFLDHVIIGNGDGYTSLREQGIIY